jgi:ketosteroid isomerase-like protein
VTWTAVDYKAAVRRWADLYNAGDIETFVLACYTDDLVAVAETGRPTPPREGARALIAFETRSHRSLPTRRIDVIRMHVAPPVVTVEAVLTAAEAPGWRLPFVSVQTYRGDLIAIDRNYGDFSTWPV